MKSTPSDPSFLLFVALSCAAALALFAPGHASAAETDACKAVEADALRLACYDRAVGRGATVPPAPGDSSVDRAGRSRPIQAPAGSGLSVAWEIDPADKRGTFNLMPHKLNYLLPVHYTSHTNALPQSPAPGHSSSTPRSVDKLEAKYQLSLKMKVLENLVGDNGDLWLAYTQLSYWQIYDSKQSSPFRTTDYEPEVFFSWRTDVDLPGWRWRMFNLGIVHQSNGNGLPLSRSWNRLYAQFGLERGNWSLLVRPWYRLPESAADDDNPDIRNYMGSADVRLSYGSAGHVYTALGRYAGSGRGYLQLDWAFPISKALKGYVQASTGYGASLIDYNHSQTTVGAGIVILPWQ